MSKLNKCFLICCMLTHSQLFSMIPENGKQEIINSQNSQVSIEKNIKETYFTSIEKDEKNIIIKFKLNINSVKENIITCFGGNVLKITVLNNESRIEILIRDNSIQYMIAYYDETGCSHKQIKQPYETYEKFYGSFVNVDTARLSYKDKILTITIAKKESKSQDMKVIVE